MVAMVRDTNTSPCIPQLAGSHTKYAAIGRGRKREFNASPIKRIGRRGYVRARPTLESLRLPICWQEQQQSKQPERHVAGSSAIYGRVMKGKYSRRASAARTNSPG